MGRRENRIQQSSGRLRPGHSQAAKGGEGRLDSPRRTNGPLVGPGRHPGGGEENSTRKQVAAYGVPLLSPMRSEIDADVDGALTGEGTCHAPRTGGIRGGAEDPVRDHRLNL